MSRLKVVWIPHKHAWCISNGFRTLWCEESEYNETVRELLAELDRQG